jgi:hypothetical protein
VNVGRSCRQPNRQFDKKNVIEVRTSSLSVFEVRTSLLQKRLQDFDIKPLFINVIFTIDSLCDTPKVKALFFDGAKGLSRPRVLKTIASSN